MTRAGLARRVRKLSRRTEQRARDVARLLRRRYTPWAGRLRLPIDSLALPRTRIEADAEAIVQTCDFMPDALSHSGDPFSASPHLDFAMRCVRDASFDFRQTEYFRLAERGHLPFPCKGRQRAEERARLFIDLIERIAANGYDAERSPIGMTGLRDGRRMVLDGKHRLAAMLALGRTDIEVAHCFENEARARWSEPAARMWPPQFYRKTLDALAAIGQPVPADMRREADELIAEIRRLDLETWADIYHPIPFEPFRHLTTQVEDTTSYGRLAMILASRPSFDGARVLDLGCNVGFYSFSLAKRGAHVTGVDAREEYIRIARDVSRLTGVEAEFVNARLSRDLVAEPFDLAICFSVVQWLMAQEGEEQGRAFLRALSESARSMFFDISVNEGGACLQCTPGHEIAFVRRLLRESTGYRTIEHVGDVHPYGTYARHVFYCSHD